MQWQYNNISHTSNSLNGLKFITQFEFLQSAFWSCVNLQHYNTHDATSPIHNTLTCVITKVCALPRLT